MNDLDTNDTTIAAPTLLVRRRMATLLPKALRTTLPPLWSTGHANAPALARVKLFDPTSQWVWCVIEATAVLTDGSTKPVRDCTDTEFATVDDVLCFGLVRGLETELGSFSLKELASVRGRLGLGIERDRFFRPTPVSAFRDDA